MNGGYEPTDEECLNPWRDENEEEELARAVQSAAITDGSEEKKPEDKPAELVFIIYHNYLCVKTQPSMQVFV